MHRPWLTFSFFFFNDTATTEIYTLSLHDALPICIDYGPSCRVRAEEAEKRALQQCKRGGARGKRARKLRTTSLDRKSTRLNSSHQIISYAVFCLKKKKQMHIHK